MADSISKVNYANAVQSAEHQDFQFNRMRRKLQRLENAEKAMQKEEVLNKEGTEYFNLEDEALLQETKNNFSDKIVDLRTEINLSEQLQNLYRKNFRNSGEFASRYLETVEIDSLWEFFADHKSLKKELDDLTDKIGSSSEGEELSQLDLVLSKYVKNKALIYMALNYVLDMLKQKKVKEKFKTQLEELIDKYEVQESAFLFNFFDITNNLNLSKSQKGINFINIAKLNSGEIEISNLKQTIQFIKDSFNDNYDKLVSIYIKLRAKQLQELNNLNFENRHQFLELLKVEQYLILAKSLNIKVNELKKKLIDQQIKINKSQSDAILQLLNFLTSLSINDITVMSLLNGWGTGKADILSKLKVIKNIQLLLLDLPKEIFGGATNRQKFSQFIKDLLITYDQQNQNSQKASVSFINPKKSTKFYV